MSDDVQIKWDDNLDSMLLGAAAKALNAAAIHTQGKMRENFVRTAPGTSSKPGDFPGIRKNRLRQSIGVIKATPQNLEAFSGTNLDYGRWLEGGAIGKARDGTEFAIPARPWCQRTLKEEEARNQEIARETYAKEIQNGLGGRQ